MISLHYPIAEEEFAGAGVAGAGAEARVDGGVILNPLLYIGGSSINVLNNFFYVA